MRDVHIGEDGWLFLTGGSNQVAEYFLNPLHFSECIPCWQTLLDERIRRASGIGAIYRHLIVPDKLGIYAAKSRLPHLDVHSAPACALRTALSANEGAANYLLALPDVRPLLLQARQLGIKTFFQTDSHWTFEGCYIAYVTLCASVGASPNLAIYEAPRLKGNMFLDLSSKLEPPLQEEYVTSLFLKNAVRVHANDLVAYKERHGMHDAGGLHVGSSVVFENHASGVDPRTLVLFGDSYSEYRAHQLTGMLAETFAQVHFVWSSGLDWNYIEAHKPAIIVSEMAERFMNMVPTDDLDLPVFSASRLNEFLVNAAQASP